MSWLIGTSPALQSWFVYNVFCRYRKSSELGIPWSFCKSVNEIGPSSLCSLCIDIRSLNCHSRKLLRLSIPLWKEGLCKTKSNGLLGDWSAPRLDSVSPIPRLCLTVGFVIHLGFFFFSHVRLWTRNGDTTDASKPTHSCTSVVV